MQNLNSLSEQQRQIYDNLAAGRTVPEIAKALGSTEALIQANITRIKSKGVALPTGQSAKAESPADTVPVTEVLGPRSTPTPSAGGSEHDRIAAEIKRSQPAVSPEQLAAIADKVAGSAVRDVQPMILLGTTIQYVKFCGGRMAAHQVIEDVFGALRAFVGDTTPDAGGETVKLPQTDRERLEFLEQNNAELREQIKQLSEQVHKANLYTTRY